MSVADAGRKFEETLKNVVHTNGRIQALVAHELPLVAAGLDWFLSEHIDLAVIADAGVRDRLDVWCGRSFDVLVVDYTFALRLTSDTGKTYGPKYLILEKQGATSRTHAVALAAEGGVTARARLIEPQRRQALSIVLNCAPLIGAAPFESRSSQVDLPDGGDLRNAGLAHYLNKSRKKSQGALLARCLWQKCPGGRANTGVWLLNRQLQNGMETSTPAR